MDTSFFDAGVGKILVAFAGGVLAATIGAFFAEYFKVRAGNVATRADMHELNERLEENTKITKRVEQNSSREDVLWRAELDYRERQLSELYGPAYGIIKTESDIYHLWLGGKMVDANLKVKQLFSQHNSRLTELIINKAHLIDGAAMPESFVRFNTNAVIFDLYAAPTEHGMVPVELSNDPRVRYPYEFADHIIQTTEKLKARIESLHLRYAQRLE